MTAKKKKQSSSQQTHKSSNGSNSQPKSTGRIKFLKAKHKEDSGKIDSSSALIPFSKYGFGYAAIVLIIGMWLPLVIIFYIISLQCRFKFMG